MSRQDFGRELNRVFDEIAGTPSPTLRDRVRSSLRQAPESRGQYWIAAVAAAVIAVLLVGVLFVANPLNRHVPSVGPFTNTPTPSASATPSAPATPTSSLPAFRCGANYGPITQNGPTVAFVSDVRTGTHPGYDRITITFNNGAPGNFEVRPQGNANFTYGGSGAPVTLQGNDGLLVIIRGADEHTSYTGPVDFKTGYSGLREARQVEDFEGTVQWGLGLSAPACYRAFLLSNPDRLVIDIQTS